MPHEVLKPRLLQYAIWAVVLCGLAGLPTSRADDAPPRAVNGDPLIVRDVSVYLLSAYGTKLNDRELFASTLPGYTLSRRPTAPREQAGTPVPTGIITFSGPPEADIDVLMEFEQGRILSHWPPGRLRSRRVLWAGIDIADETEIAPSPMPQGHWLLPLREADRLYTVGNKYADRFLLYDAELPYAPHVTLQRSDEGYTLTNSGKFPVRDIAVYRPVEEGVWEVAATAEVDAAALNQDADENDAGTDDAEKPPQEKPAPAATPQPAPAPAAAAVKAAAAAAEAQAAAAEAAAATGESAGAQPQGKAKPKPKPPAGTSAPLSISGQVSAEQALQSWHETLSSLNLEEPEIAFVLGILRQQALRNDSAMLVYRLDEAQIEKLLPLEVTPYPDRLFRVGLVIVQDADPDLQSQVETLVTQLGHDDWRRREAAQEQLAELGLAAKPKLEAALKHKDAEIVFRAEQLLESLKATPTP